MCIFQKVKFELYSETPRLFPFYYQPGESEREHRSRMFVERKKRRQENKESNQKGKVIGA